MRKREFNANRHQTPGYLISQRELSPQSFDGQANLDNIINSAAPYISALSAAMSAPSTFMAQKHFLPRSLSEAPKR